MSLTSNHVDINPLVLEVGEENRSNLVPFFNRWDIYPIVGTLIGSCRIIYGIAKVIFDHITAWFREPFDKMEGVKHITRGFVSLVSFFPFARRWLEKENIKLANPPVLEEDEKVQRAEEEWRHVSFESLLEKAHQGDAAAQFYLGKCYFYGDSYQLEGVECDHYKAAEWFRRASDQEHMDAKVFFGYCLSLGLGVPQDRDEARVYLEKAAEMGSADAYNNLMLLDMIFIQEQKKPLNRNKERQLEITIADYFGFCRKAGNVHALYNLGLWLFAQNKKEFRLAECSSPSQAKVGLGYDFTSKKEKNLRLITSSLARKKEGPDYQTTLTFAIQCVENAAEKGHVKAQYFLGCLYFVGKQSFGRGKGFDVGKDKDEKKAQ